MLEIFYLSYAYSNKPFTLLFYIVVNYFPDKTAKNINGDCPLLDMA